MGTWPAHITSLFSMARRHNVFFSVAGRFRLNKACSDYYLRVSFGSLRLFKSLNWRGQACMHSRALGWGELASVVLVHSKPKLLMDPWPTPQNLCGSFHPQCLNASSTFEKWVSCKPWHSAVCCDIFSWEVLAINRRAGLFSWLMTLPCVWMQLSPAQ